MVSYHHYPTPAKQFTIGHSVSTLQMFHGVVPAFATCLKRVSRQPKWLEPGARSNANLLVSLEFRGDLT